MANLIDECTLESFLGLNIESICECCYVPDNNCAHFVAHVLQLRFPAAVTCDGLKVGSRRGVCIRADDLYNHCSQAGPWADRPKTSGPYLAFLASKGVDAKNCMVQVPWKHVGIYQTGYIYHHAGKGKLGKVYRHQPEQWLGWMKYPKGTEMYFGSLPI